MRVPMSLSFEPSRVRPISIPRSETAVIRHFQERVSLPLHFERPMLCAPIPDAVRSNSLIRADNAVDGMTLKQLSTGILKRCLSGGLATSDVVLIDCTMQHPLRHSFSSRLP